MNEITKRLMRYCPYSSHFQTTSYLSCEAFAMNLAKDAKVVYGRTDCQLYMKTSSAGSVPSNVTAILLDVQEIDQSVSISEVIKHLRERFKTGSLHDNLLADRIEKHGLRP